MLAALALAIELRQRAYQHPYGALVVAAGVGYVVGGGLFSRLTVNALGVGLRLAALPVVQRELVRLAQAQISTSAEPVH